MSLKRSHFYGTHYYNTNELWMHYMFTTTRGRIALPFCCMTIKGLPFHKRFAYYPYLSAAILIILFYYFNMKCYTE